VLPPLPCSLSQHQALASSSHRTGKLNKSSSDLLPTTEELMEPELNIDSDLRLSKRTSLPLLKETMLTTMPSTESTNLLTGLLTNSTPSSDFKFHQPERSELSFQKLKLPMMSIGLPKEWLPQSRTKECVDHAGLSPLSEPLNQDLPSHQEPRPSKNGLNNNLLIAQEATEIKDVTEDGWTMPSNMLKIMKNTLKRTTDTLPEMRLAKLLLMLERPQSRILDMLILPKAKMLLRKPLPKDPLLLPLMLQTGHHTDQESSPTVELD
jgi:hypothetical protein